MKYQIIIALLLCASCNKKLKETVFEQETTQPEVLTRTGIDSILNLFKQTSYTNLSNEYKNYTDPDRKFENALKNRTFYTVKGDEIYTKVIGNFAVKDFLAKDDFYKKNIKNPELNMKQYWLIDKEVLYMMLQLIHRLDEMGHNMYGFHVRNSHRHPTQNTSVNGAKYSQHMFGRAIDIGVDDVNQDGKSNRADKTIIYDILEDIVGYQGGLGKYPGTMNLHFDCRGFKARWDFP